MRPIVAGFVFATVAAAIAIAASCTPLPSKTCYAQRVNAFEGDAAADDCTSCLQTSACCDLVGECGDDQTCIDNFRATQSCVALGGPGKEADCKSNLQSPKSQALYSCMRKPCGRQCGIPSCNLDPAVVLIVDPACDRCLTGACCDSINACYGNRQCKLFLECITQHCPVSLGTSMTKAGAQPHDEIVSASHAACNEGGTFDPVFDPGPCLDRCLNAFAPDDDASTADDHEARCLAFGVYTCGAGAGCGPTCLNDGGASEGTPYPEDGVDSGTP